MSFLLDRLVGVPEVARFSHERHLPAGVEAHAKATIALCETYNGPYHLHPVARTLRLHARHPARPKASIAGHFHRKPVARGRDQRPPGLGVKGPNAGAQRARGRPEAGSALQKHDEGIFIGEGARQKALRRAAHGQPIRAPEERPRDVVEDDSPMRGGEPHVEGRHLSGVVDRFPLRIDQGGSVRAGDSFDEVRQNLLKRARVHVPRRRAGRTRTALRWYTGGHID
jgi:hypothetical protein